MPASFNENSKILKHLVEKAKCYEFQYHLQQEYR